MAAFGLDLDSPLLPNVDTYINPTKSDDEHLSALNSVVINVHRAGSGAFERLVAVDLGEYLSNADAKVRERATLLLAELLSRLPELPLSPMAAPRFAEFFASRLGDYPSVVPALRALAALVKNHAPALVGREAGASRAPEARDVSTADEAGRGAGQEASGVESAEVIASGIFEELHVPALSQSIRQATLSVLRALVSESGLREALSSTMGASFVIGLVKSMEGEKDPRCLIVGLAALRRTQEGFAAAVLEETSEAVFDATACYFPVTFTPPPNDPHNISPDALKTGLQEVLVGSPGMARHVLPMLLDKLSSEVSTAKEASLKALVAAVRAFGVPAVGMRLRAVGEAMFDEAVHGVDPDLAALALASLAAVVREIASHAELTGLGEACPEWGMLPRPMLEQAVMEALALTSALALRCALAMAVPRLLRARAQARAQASSDVSMKATEPSAAAAAAAAEQEDGDVDAARLDALAGLIASVDSEVDFTGARDGAPLEPFAEKLVEEMSNAFRIAAGSLSACDDRTSGYPLSKTLLEASSAGSKGACIAAARGLSDLVTRPPTALLGRDRVESIVALLSTALDAPEAWGRLSDVGGGSGGLLKVVQDERAPASVILAAIRSIGLRRPEYGRIVVEKVVPDQLSRLSEASSLCPKSGDPAFHAAESESSERTARSSRLPSAERALAALVLLSEIPGVFTVAVPAILAEAVIIHEDGDGSDDSDKFAAIFLGSRRLSALALSALDEALRRGVEWGHTADLLSFIRVDEVPLSPVPRANTPPGSSGDGTAAEPRRQGPRGLPLLLAALASSPPALHDSTSSSSSRTIDCRPARCASSGDAVSESQDHESAASSAAIAEASALGTAVSVVRTCTRAAPAEDQEALLSSLLYPLVPLGRRAGAHADGEASNGSSGGGSRGIRIDRPPLLAAVAAVIGAMRYDSKALGPGGVAAGAVPALLSGALAEGAAGLEHMKENRAPLASGHDAGGERAGRAGRANAVAAIAPCSQCLAVVLNKLAPGSELEALLVAVVGALQEAFSAVRRQMSGASEAMDVDPESGSASCAPGVGPIQCLAWVTKAVAMRGGLAKAFSALLELLCDLVVSPAAIRGNADEYRGSDASGGGDGERVAQALAAAAAFGIVLGQQEGGALRADDAVSGTGARVSPLWRQRLFVQTFPTLQSACRAPMVYGAGGRGEGSACYDATSDASPVEMDTPSSSGSEAAQSASGSMNKANTPDERGSSPGGARGVHGGSGAPQRRGGTAAEHRAPALLALLHVAREVPPEALSLELETVVASVVQAMGSAHPPLQSAAVDTFEVLSRDHLAAFGQHMSSLIPLLLSVAEGAGGGRDAAATGVRTGTPPPASTAREAATGGLDGAMRRYAAIQCLGKIAALPYPRVHPFKTQVKRRLRVPLDDERRAVRQAAAQARNVWYLLG